MRTVLFLQYTFIVVSSDLTKMGIIEKTHQEALLNSINKVGLPTYAESTVLHPHVGISV